MNVAVRVGHLAAWTAIVYVPRSADVPRPAGRGERVGGGPRAAVGRRRRSPTNVAGTSNPFGPVTRIALLLLITVRR